MDNLPFLSDLSEDMQNIILRLCALVLAIVLIVVLRRVLTWIIVRPLRKITTRNGPSRDDEILDALILPMRYLVIAAALLVSVRILGAGDAISALVERFGRTLIIIAILLVIYRLIDIFMPSSNRLFAITGLSIQEKLLPFLRTAIKLVIICIGLVIVIQEWGYDVSGLIAGIGIGGLAISLAAQDTIANLFGFTAIVGDRPFDVGEYIVTPDVEGLVEHVGIRSTRVRRLDQALVTVPNNKLANSAILNWSRLQKRRIDMNLGVTYDASSEDMRVLLHRIREMLSVRDTVQPDSVVVYFVEFGDSALNILVRCYVNLADWGEFTAEKELVYLEIMDIISELGMSVAFPSRSLYLENLPDLALNVEAARRQFNNTTIHNSVPDPRKSPRERALLQEEARAKREAEIPPPHEPTPQEGSETDLPEADDDNR
ncbi:MAG: mechanosensitive ion channel family protein [Aggregatilineales bacterium]